MQDASRTEQDWRILAEMEWFKELEQVEQWMILTTNKTARLPSELVDAALRVHRQKGQHLNDLVRHIYALLLLTTRMRCGPPTSSTAMRTRTCCGGG